MKKMLLGLIVFLALSFGFAVYYLLSNLDGIVKTAIESYGSQATQTSVRVEEVRIVLKDGSGVIRGLTVGNPQGFSAQQAFSLGEISTQIDLNSLSGEVTIIEQITVRAPEVFFELNTTGKNNLSELKKKLSSGASEKSAPSSSSQSSDVASKLIIRKLLFVDGNIHASAAPVKKDFRLKLPKIELNNLGGKKGATPSQIANQILNILTDKSLVEIKKKGLDQYKAKLEGEINKALSTEKEKVGDRLKDVLNY